MLKTMKMRLRKLEQLSNPQPANIFLFNPLLNGDEQRAWAEAEASALHFCIILPTECTGDEWEAEVSRYLLGHQP